VRVNEAVGACIGRIRTIVLPNHRSYRLKERRYHRNDHAGSTEFKSYLPAGPSLRTDPGAIHCDEHRIDFCHSIHIESARIQSDVSCRRATTDIFGATDVDGAQTRGCVFVLKQSDHRMGRRTRESVRAPADGKTTVGSGHPIT